MARLRYNGLVTTLATAGLTATDTTVTFTAALSSVAGPVPSITGSDYIPLTIFDSSGQVVKEIVNLTAYTSGAVAGTIARAQEGTTAVAHAGSMKVVNGPTAADFAPPLVWAAGSVTAGPVPNFTSSGGPYARVVSAPTFKKAIRATQAIVQTIAAGTYAIVIDGITVWTGSLTDTTGANTTVTFTAPFSIYPGSHTIEWQKTDSLGQLRCSNTASEDAYMVNPVNGTFYTALVGGTPTSGYTPAIRFIGQSGYWNQDV